MGREIRSSLLIKNFKYQVVGLSELCRGKAVVAYAKPQQMKKEESKRLRGERDQIKFIDLRFERWRVERCRKARRTEERKTFHKLHVFKVNGL